MNLKFILIADEGRVPDCVVLHVNAMNFKGAVRQRTLARGADDGWAFWQRINREARDVAYGMGCGLGACPTVVVFCKYGSDAECALRKNDDVENLKLTLSSIAHNDSSPIMRINALTRLLDLDRRTLQ